jgi:hypothetical protein
MNVRELIELLQDMDEDLEVHFSYNYGDHWRTEVAPVVDTVEVANVTYSDYHEMHRLVDDNEDDGDEGDDGGDDGVKRVVVLK